MVIGWAPCDERTYKVRLSAGANTASAGFEVAAERGESGSGR